MNIIFIFSKPLKMHAAGQRGIALVVVLWVLALLMIIATELVYTVRVDSKSAANFSDETGAQAQVAAGINIGLTEISVPYKFVVLDSEGSVRFIRQQDDKEKPERAFDLGEGRFKYVIEDESGKLNLNTASREIIVNLLRNSGISGSALDTLVDSIIDWRDDNHEHHLNGAEDDFYNSLPKPYGAKDGPFDTVEEVLLVKGMSPEIFYGKEKARLNGTNLSESEFKGIAQHLTVWGDGKININTAGEEVLKAAFGEGTAHEILLRRKTEGYYNLPAFGGVVSSGVFSVISTGTVHGLSFKVRALVKKMGSDVKIIYLNEEGFPVGAE
ncbi:MAG: general secretion pathway protein GspK [Deltaproteobacteria bacterium]|nr:general secretion pathway protein GspK [Deltaproteobacteria bacterium]